VAVRYSPSTRGFYDSEVHEEIPSDGVALTRTQYEALLAAQAGGKTIVMSGGTPVAAAPPAPTLAQARAVAVARMRAEGARRMLVVAPMWRQSNDNGLIAMAAYQIASEDVTTIDIASALQRRGAIDVLRARGDQLEATIAAMTEAQLAAFDPTLDSHWT
jgi:hypothetical protein